MSEKPEPKKFGNVVRKVRTGDRIVLAIDGVEIGYFEIHSIPRDLSARVSCRFDRRVRIYRPQETSDV